MKWLEFAKAAGGLATVGTLLAHFIHPALPLTAVRVQVLLFLIGVLLIGDWVAEQYPVLISVSTGNENEGDE